MKLLMSALMLLAFCAAPLKAQRREPTDFAARSSARPVASAAVVTPTHEDLVTGGLKGALLIGAIGGVAGFFAEQDCGGYVCGVRGAVIGLMVGEAIGVPIGVKRAGGKGSLATQMLVSFAVLGAGIWGAPISSGLSLLPVIPIQIALVVNDAARTRNEETR